MLEHTPKLMSIAYCCVRVSTVPFVRYHTRIGLSARGCAEYGLAPDARNRQASAHVVLSSCCCASDVSRKVSAGIG
jgi:hypothetical protein